MREMVKIPHPEEIANNFSGGQAALKSKKEDLKGIDIQDGSVLLSPAINAPA